MLTVQEYARTSHAGYSTRSWPHCILCYCTCTSLLMILLPGVHDRLIRQGERRVRILSISTSGAIIGIPQEMRHPRELEYIVWRKPRTSS
jgi:hypothetical protein